MSKLQLAVLNSEDIRNIIINAHNSGLTSVDWPLIYALTQDYQKWFKEIMNVVDIPERRKDLRWQEGEPRWVLVFDKHGSLLAYASLFVSNMRYFSFHPHKILDVFIKDGENILEIVPVLRSAIGDLFWLKEFQQEHPPQEELKSLNRKKNKKKASGKV